MSDILTADEQAQAVDAYLECAGWLVSSHEGHPEDDERGYEGDHRAGPFSDDAYAHAIDAVADFVNLAGAEDVRAYLEARGQEPRHDYGSASLMGHDLWLTRNGHGAGFWDRGLGALGDRLSDAARSMGEADSWVRDDEDETVEVEG